MPFSSGTFNLFTPGNPTVSGTTISSTWANNTLTDVATGLSTCILKDGTQTVTANITLSGFKITNLAAGTAVSDAARLSQVQNSSTTSLTAVAGTNTITATATPTPAAYVVGQIFDGIAVNTNTGATTLNISGLGAGAVQVAGVALAGGEIKANGPFTVMVSAVTPVFQLVANGAPPFIDTAAIIKGSVDGTKLIRFEVDGLTTATTRTLTVNDNDSTIGKGPILQTFTASGTYTPTTGMRLCKVTVVGPGGGGGGAANGANTGAGGGGAGATSIRYLTAAQIGVSQTVTIGAGGSGGAAGSNNGNPGTTNSSLGALAVGGFGGAGAGALAGTAGNGGTGGTATTGDINISGGSGNSSAAQGVGGSGGNSTFGGGGQTGNQGGGAAGTAYGAGGGGGGSAGGGASGGGNGKDGIVIVEEFF